MVVIRIKGGTPEEGASLCGSCSWGVVRSGFSATEVETFCRLIDPARVPFKVRECSSYEDRSRANLRDMERIAWVLLTKAAGRSIGFVTSARFRELEGDEAEIVPRDAASRPEQASENRP